MVNECVEFMNALLVLVKLHIRLKTAIHALYEWFYPFISKLP